MVSHDHSLNRVNLSRITGFTISGQSAMGDVRFYADVSWELAKSLIS